MEKILTVNDVATILQVKAITVREMFREKRIRGFKVGKAWRTTEIMLREDIDAIARGEAPAELPAPAVRAGAQRTKSTAPVAGGNRPAAPVAGGVGDAVPKPKKKSPGKPADSDGATDTEDTQQFLF